MEGPNPFSVLEEKRSAFHIFHVIRKRVVNTHFQGVCPDCYNIKFGGRGVFPNYYDITLYYVINGQPLTGGVEFRNLQIFEGFPPKNSKRVDLADEWLEEQSKSKDRKPGSSQCSDKVV